MKTLFPVLIALIFSLPVFGQDESKLRVKGFTDSYHAVRIEKPNDFLASRSRFRGEMEKVNGHSYFFISVNAVHNNVLPELTKIQFREAYMEYSGNNWGFKAGRQIIIWGKADGLKITDLISPMDLTEFLAQDYDDIRMPVNGIVFSKFSTYWDLDLVCIPVFESYLLPGENNPWGFNYSEAGIVEDQSITPDPRLLNMEFGGKLSLYFSGVDVEISALNTWNKSPVYTYYTDDSTSILHIVPEHHRMGFIGAGFSKSLSTFIFRGEAAFYPNKKYSPGTEHFDRGLSERKSINYLLGIDWYPGNEWNISGQFSDEYITRYSPVIAQKEHSLISTLGISKKILRSTLKLSSFAYIGLEEGDFFNRTSIDYSLSDNIHLTGGIDWIHGDAGIFGQYSKNSQAWIKAKFNF